MARRAIFTAPLVAVLGLVAPGANAHTLLRPGDVGADVLLWQKMVNMGRPHPIAEDGVFGPETARASRQFDINDDGTIDPRDRRNWISGFLTCCGAEKPTISRGSYGILVGHAQLKLNEWLRDIDAEPLTIDLLFGPATETATHHYQAAHGLSVDGIVGPSTWADILRLPSRA